MMLDGPMKDPTSMGWPQSVPIVSELEFSKLLERSRVHSGLLFAVVLAADIMGRECAYHARL
jgi:simple sugar transport system permease protein